MYKRQAMSDYIFNGGDGAAFFKNSEAPVIKMPLYIRDVLVKAFKTTGPGPIQVTLDGRTKVVSN